MLELTDVMAGHASCTRHIGIGGAAALDFQRAAGRQIDSIKAGALPRASVGDEAGRRDGAAMGANVEAAGLCLQAVVARGGGRRAEQVGDGSVGALRARDAITWRRNLFGEQRLRAAPRVLAHQRRGIRCADAVVPPAQPFGGALPEVDDGEHQRSWSAFSNTASNISVVRRPVFVLSCEQW